MAGWIEVLKSLEHAVLRLADRRAFAELRPALDETLEARRALASFDSIALEARARELRAMAGAAEFARTCALASEIAVRALGLDPRPEQILAAAALHRGAVAELPTGEGKTLAAALAAFVEATSGRAVHVIPPNDYLAARDAEQMAPLFRVAGFSVGLARPGEPLAAKRQAYRAEVVYGSGRELGFDHLRDGQRLRAIDRVQRGLDVAILDEVDSLLLDEALTPLVLGGSAQRSSAELFRVAMDAVERLRPEVDFDVDERGFSRTLTETGAARLEALLRDLGALGEGTLHDAVNADLARITHQSLRALGMRRDRDYLVTPEGAVLPLDRHTGRALAGRRWGDGLHQAIEAKERVRVTAEHRTRAMCSFERFLRSYAKVSGMTGTARGVSGELQEIHGLRVYRLPPHRPCARVDEPDRVFVTEREKLDALAAEVERCHRRGQPLLVGVPSEEKSLVVSRMLDARAIPHRLLTAKHHAAEAAIVANAGRAGAVTVATQVAGRGTDIVLGGEDVRALGGLRVLGLERHLRRRIDDQLRGRAGRGGDPGSSCFFVSLEDELLARHAEPSVRRAIAAIRSITPEVERKARAYADDAQERVEAVDADRRVLGRKLDAIFEEQRRAVAEQRARMLAGRASVGEPGPVVAELERGLREALRLPVERLVAAHVRASEGASVPTRAVRPRMLAREAYRLFGCEVDLEGRAGSPAEATETLVLATARSFASQWANLLALAARVVGAIRRAASGSQEAFADALRDALGISLAAPTADASLDDCAARALAEVRAALQARARAELPRRVLRYFRLVYLDELDRAWTAQVAELTGLRDELSLRVYARGDPLVAYKREAYGAFRAMMASVERAALARLLSAPRLDRDALEALETELYEARGGRGAVA